MLILLFLLNKNVFENVKCQIEFKLDTPRKPKYKYNVRKNIKIFLHDLLFLFYFYDWITLLSLVSVFTRVIAKIALLVKDTDV